MGAHNIEFTINKKANYSEIKKAFKHKKSNDQYDNGYQDGYSGDFQTVNDVKFHNKVFNSFNEAHEYCLEHAQKWSFVVAVYFRDADLSKNKTLIKLKEKLNSEMIKLREVTKQEVDKIKMAKSKTISCSKCQSKLTRKFLVFNSSSSATCPVCRENLLSNTAKKRIENQTKKVTELKTKINLTETKLSEKSNNLKTLIAGWGAC